MLSQNDLLKNEDGQGGESQNTDLLLYLYCHISAPSISRKFVIISLYSLSFHVHAKSC